MARQKIHTKALEDRITLLALENPELAQRARQRLLAREIEGQLNVENIAEQATLALPSVVSKEPVSADWRRKFFQEAENVCEVDMQALWGKVLAGEIARPGSFNLRTLETLKQLTKNEAEIFRQICGIAMEDGWVALPNPDINTALMPYGFSFNSILQLRDAGLISNGDNLQRKFVANDATEPPGIHKATVYNNDVIIELSGPALVNLQIPVVAFTQAGKELQQLIFKSPNEQYLSEFGASIRRVGVSAKRGKFVVQNENVSFLVFEQDL